MVKDYDYIMDKLANGSVKELEEISELIDEFPDGKDDFINRKWIINAIDCGSKLSIEWMLSKNVDLDFRDEEGYTALLSALEREAPDKYEILELLLQNNAPINLHGINDWTAAHMAAARNDVGALKMLVKYGADLSIKTNIDNYATPLEEAKILKAKEAIEYLKSIA